MHGGRWLTVVLCGVGLGPGALATAPAPLPGVRAFDAARGADAAVVGSSHESTASADVGPVCAPSVQGARDTVLRRFRELADAYEDVLPGPRGQALLQRELDRIIDASVDVGAFARWSLRVAWDQVDADTRARWGEALRLMLRARYRRRLQDPRTQRLEIQRTALDCERATVWTRTIDRRGRASSRVVVFRLVFHPEAGADAWRVYDVAVDGTSLLATYRGRFVKVYREGGVSALDRHLRSVAARYATKPP